ncbi:hypothetical protein ACFYW6_34120 [Streptomyces sp. NPDC002659]|uniref:hypothetical protein n=1 Tax=Streptomyces sp. NPDC002659 TaxID=3364656 RepID=UPI00367CD5E8
MPSSTPMDAKAYNTALTELRGVRDDIRAVAKDLDKLQRELQQLESDRDARIVELAAYEKAKADRIAPAAGLSVADVATLAPALGSSSTAVQQPAQATPTAQPAAGAPAPDLRRPAAVPVVPFENAEQAAAAAAAPATTDEGPEPVTATALTKPDGEERELPSIPAGERGDGWAAAAANLVSRRPNYTQQVWDTAFLDAETGMLVHKSNSGPVDLGSRSAADIVTAVAAVLPESVERIYITAGDPWHRDAGRFPYLTDAVADWLNAPVPGWTVASGKGQARGKDRLAGHFVHERLPVGRWQRGPRHLELCPIGSWFDPEGADPVTVRDAFVQLWKALHEHWPDVVLMGSPARTGRDLWSRTIPTKTGAKWADGYPVMSSEIRGLLHATAGQGRAELLLPPQVPEQLPQITELDRTFAYAKHTWIGAVGAPQRVSAATFASWTEKEQINALYAPSHWQIRVTVPQGWNHVGLLPAPVTGEAAWTYPNEPGRTFVTWAGGAEVNLALRNHLMPWKIEILDGLVWESGSPLREWADKLKEAWNRLTSLAALHGDERERTAAHLAARAVRSILLYGIGAFAQRPRLTTGSAPVGEERSIPPGAEIISTEGEFITWERRTFSPDPYAHPEWAAGVWSGARAGLLSLRMRQDNVSVGALHLPPGSIIAFRTDAIYTTADVSWPYHGQPGDYLKKGHLPFPTAAPTTLTELMALKSLGRGFASDYENGLETAVRAAGGDADMAQRWLQDRQEA